MRYGFQEEAERLAYKWLYMVTKAFVDFNGVVVEKYNVTRELDPHKVEAEYGNQGKSFVHIHFRETDIEQEVISAECPEKASAGSMPATCTDCRSCQCT